MSKKALLLVNLGSPDSYQEQDVKVYLREFLMDERVIDKPYWLRYLLIEGIILKTRPAKSGEAYKSIWWDEGSPLVVISERFNLQGLHVLCWIQIYPGAQITCSYMVVTGLVPTKT